MRSSALRAVLRDPRVLKAALASRSFVPNFVFTAMQQMDARLREFNSTPQKRAPLAQALRARLKQEFAPEVNRLSELLECDLTRWNEDRPPPQHQRVHSGATVSAA